MGMGVFDATIYVVEDDPDIAEIVSDNLRREGFRVVIYADGMEAYESILSHNPDLIILDLNLPGMSGIELCKYLREEPQTSEIPVIMLTARGEEIDKIIGFEVGADDYVTKPFSPRELLARVRVHLKRARKTAVQPFRQGPLMVNFDTHEVLLDNQAIELTPIQFKLLKTLIQANGRVLSRQQLLEIVWGPDYYGDPRTVDVHIARLRDRLRNAGRFIKTIKGTGYRWETP